MSITTTERTNIEKLLVLMFNAAPGSTYLQMVTSLYETLGHDLAALANTLDDIPAYTALNPNFQTAEEFAAEFLTPLGLESDALALSFVIDKFNAGVPKGQIAYEALVALNGVDSSMAAQYVNAKAILDNKAAVSDYYSATVGVAQTDIAVLQSVLDGITADTATVTSANAEIDAGTRGSAGVELTLSPSQDSIVGSAAADVINGLFGDAVTASNNTFTAGDSIDGGAGTDNLNLVALGTLTSSAIIVKNVEAINIQDTVGATFNALLVENAPGINFTNTLTGLTSTVNGLAAGSVVGLSGAGNLTVDYSSTSGTADLASISVNGAGTSATARSTINVSDTNTVEKVNVATAGTNFVTLTAGTAAASITLTGAGTNNFDLSAAGATAALLTLDASASTGTNTFVMGNTLGGGDTVKGGTGADTVSAAFTSASLVNPTMTGVETMTVTSYGAAAVLGLGSTTGLTKIGVTTSAANMQVLDAASTVTSFTLSKLTLADATLKFGYTSTDKGNLALNLGSATSTAVNLGAVTLTNTASVAIATTGAFAHDADNISIAGDQTAVSVNVGAGGDFTPGTVTVTGNVGALTQTVGAASYYSGGVVAAGKTISAVNVSVAAGGEYNGQIDAKAFGDMTFTATGNAAELAEYAYATDGDVGNINISVDGNNASGFVGVTASGGGFGDVTVSATGDAVELGVYLSGGSGYGGESTETMGNVSMTVDGDDSETELYVNMSGGNVGNITYSVTGATASGYGEVNVARTYYTNGDGVYEVAGGGSVGNISLNIDGDSAGMGFYVYTSGGSLGDISITADNGGMFQGNFRTNDTRWFSGGGIDPNAGNVGNINISVGADSSVSGSVSADGGDIASLTVNVTGSNASGGFGVYANSASAGAPGNVENDQGDDYADGGNIGHIAVDVDGADASFYVYAYASGGDIDGVDYSLAGAGASGYVKLSSQRSASGSTGGDIGAINITLADNTDAFELDLNFDGAAALTVVAGDDTASGNFYISGGWNYDNTDSASLTANLTYGENANTWFEVNGFSGSVELLTVSYGDGSSAGFQFSGLTGDIGPITGTFGAGQDLFVGISNVDGSVAATSLTFGTDAHFWYGVSGDGGMASFGQITVAGGDATSSGGISLSDTGNPIAVFGGVDATAWLGEIYIDAEGANLSGNLKVGAGGSWVRGSEGGDNIFLGAGVDTVALDMTPTAVDTIFSFKVGTGGDVIDLIAAATAIETTLTADGAMVGDSGDIVRLVDITGGQDITTAAGLILALEAGGEYATVSETASAAFTIVTAASATSSQLYLFNVVDTDADAVFETGEVTLVGIVNLTTAAGPAGLVLGNFA